jgi:hypothetical protein
MDTRLTTLISKKNDCHEIQRGETGLNQTESYKEGYGSKSAVLSMMMIF